MRVSYKLFYGKLQDGWTKIKNTRKTTVECAPRWNLETFTNTTVSSVLVPTHSNHISGCISESRRRSECFLSRFCTIEMTVFNMCIPRSTTVNVTIESMVSVLNLPSYTSIPCFLMLLCYFGLSSIKILYYCIRMNDKKVNNNNSRYLVIYNLRMQSK